MYGVAESGEVVGGLLRGELAMAEMLYDARLDTQT